MRAISVRQPWAWAILHGKPVENRSKPLPLGAWVVPEDIEEAIRTGGHGNG